MSKKSVLNSEQAGLELEAAISGDQSLEVQRELMLAAAVAEQEHTATVAQWSALSVSDADAVKLYREMVMIRHFEEYAAKGFTQGRVGGYFHTCVGQEGSVVGLVSALREEDY